MQPKLWQLSIVLLIGILAVSAAAIFIRLAMDSAANYTIGFSLFLSAFRLVISALILLPTWGKIKQVQVSSQTYYLAIAAGICLGFHFATWISSLAFTSVAASTTLVTTNPIWVALFSRWWFKEKLSYKTAIAIAIALFGSVLIAVADSSSVGNNPNSLLGAILALIGAIMASSYIIFSRQAQQQGLSLTSYIAIAYSTAALILLPLPVLFGASYGGYPEEVYIYGFLMAIFSQIIGHTSFNWALRWLSPTIVTLCILVEPVGSSILAWIILQEIPSMGVIVGGLILLLGVTMAVMSSE
ncbi:MAG: DMT family transporter [Xenococcaceae cyanobacterium MO_167.B52]|nr:DMT family transporter [Xenococcaceae cyanobacterium MO_167.B52]